MADISSDGLTKAVAVLRELGSAWRGDWNDFDGRTLRAQLDSWIDDVLLVPETERDKGIVGWRRSCGLCPLGDGCWVGYCNHPHGERSVDV